MWIRLSVPSCEQALVMHCEGRKHWDKEKQNERGLVTRKVICAFIAVSVCVLTAP